MDWPELPPRRAGNYLGFLGGVLALTVESYGQRLRFFVPPSQEDIDALTAPLRHLAGLRKRIRVVTINDQPAKASPYLEALDRCLTRRADHRHLYYER